MRWTYILILSWVLTGLYVYTIPIEERAQIVENYAYSTDNVLQGKWWVFFTSVFLHGGLLHLLMNAAAFFFFGLAVEHEIGYRRMLLIFFAGAFAGNLVSSLFYPADALSIGASGGVSAVLGTAMLVAPFKFSMAPFLAPAPILLVGVIYVITNLVGLFSGLEGNISYAAHVGGLGLGLIYGFHKVGRKRGTKLILLGLILYLLFALLYYFIFA
jgi:membrane associated rhomboid family serine protease